MDSFPLSRVFHDPETLAMAQQLCERLKSGSLDSYDPWSLPIPHYSAQPVFLLNHNPQDNFMVTKLTASLQKNLNLQSNESKGNDSAPALAYGGLENEVVMEECEMVPEEFVKNFVQSLRPRAPELLELFQNALSFSSKILLSFLTTLAEIDLNFTQLAYFIGVLLSCEDQASLTLTGQIFRLILLPKITRSETAIPRDFVGALTKLYQKHPLLLKEKVMVPLMFSADLNSSQATLLCQLLKLAVLSDEEKGRFLAEILPSINLWNRNQFVVMKSVLEVIELRHYADTLDRIVAGINLFNGKSESGNVDSFVDVAKLMLIKFAESISEESLITLQDRTKT